MTPPTVMNLRRLSSLVTVAMTVCFVLWCFNSGVICDNNIISTSVHDLAQHDM